MNFTNLLAHVKSGKLARTVLITGDGPSAHTMEKLVTDYWGAQNDDYFQARHIYPQSIQHLKDSLAFHDLPGVQQTFIIVGALPMLTEKDAPWLDRALNKRADLSMIWTGDPVVDPVIRATFTRTTAKTYEAGFGDTPGQQKNFVGWLAHVSGLSTAYAQIAAEAVGWDEDLAYALVTKATLLGESVTPHALTLLGQDFNRLSFVDALIEHRLNQAAALAHEVTPSEVPKVVKQLAATVRLLGRIYPATQKFSAPSIGTAKVTGVPLSTQTKYWNIAGRYSPTDVARHLLILSKTADLSTTPKTGALLNLVLSW